MLKLFLWLTILNRVGHEAAKEARKLASYSLRDAVRFEITQTIKYLVEKEERIYPSAIDAYNAWIERKMS